MQASSQGAGLVSNALTAAKETSARDGGQACLTIDAFSWPGRWVRKLDLLCLLERVHAIAEVTAEHRVGGRELFRLAANACEVG